MSRAAAAPSASSDASHASASSASREKPRPLRKANSVPGSVSSRALRRSTVGPGLIEGGAPRSCVYCANQTLLQDVLPPKRCDYCKELKCQFCTLRIPLLTPGRRMLPKSMKVNSRICVECFGCQWKHNGMNSVRNSMYHRAKSMTTISRESIHHPLLTRPTSLSADSINETNMNKKAALEEQSGCDILQAEQGQHVIGETKTPRRMLLLDIGVALVTTLSGVMVALAEMMSVYMRLTLMMSISAGFLGIYSWCHRSQAYQKKPHAHAGSTRHLPDSKKKDVSSADNKKRRLRGERGSQSFVEHTSLPSAYVQTIQRLESLQAFYVGNKECWRVVRSRNNIMISELMGNDSPIPMFKAEAYVSGISSKDFIEYVDSKYPKDRAVWDSNVDDFYVVESFPEATICCNVQKPFLGGLVSARDFLVLNLRRDKWLGSASVEHAKAPERSGVVRGMIMFSCFSCEDSERNGIQGFDLTYICQVDIKGSLPVKLLYNGTLDNVEKMTKSFMEANKRFRK